jgi:hypothetical protein
MALPPVRRTRTPPKRKNPRARNLPAPPRNPRRKKRTRRMKMMIHMPSQSWSHAAAAIASALMNSPRSLPAVDASQLNVVQ